MVAIKYWMFFFSVLVLSNSCQKVITIDLSKAPVQYVIDAQLANKTGWDTVKLSKTASYFSNDKFPKISGALVYLISDHGTLDTLKEVLPGVYVKPKMYGRYNYNYQLKVMVEGKIFKASSKMPLPIQIGSIGVFPNQPLIGNAKGNAVICYFQDPKGVPNYYRLKEFVNDSLYDVGGIQLFSDKYSDGKYIDYTMPKEVYNGDKVKIELISLNEDTYNYYVGINNASSGSAGNVSPANPISNIDNGALGYFGAFSVVSESWTVH